MPDVRAVGYDYSGPLVMARDLSSMYAAVINWSAPRARARDLSQGNL